MIRPLLFEDFMNLTSKCVYYIKDKDGMSYQMRPLIYDSRFKLNEETPLAMVWILFPKLLPSFFVKECLFTLASAVRKALQMDMATINKTMPCCDIIKVLFDLLAKHLRRSVWTLLMRRLESQELRW